MSFEASSSKNLETRNFFVHPMSDVQSKNIGYDTKVWQFTVILPGATIGSNCNINAHCFIENDVIIGDNVTIKCGVYVWDGIEIGDNVFVGPNVTFTNDKLPRSKQHQKIIPKTRILKGVSIGANAVILPGLTIGVDAVIGAGAVVTKDVPDGATVIGSPAKLYKKVET